MNQAGHAFDCYSGSGRAFSFDLLYLNGKDQRVLPLLERKAMLKKLLRRKRSRILYRDHVEADGCLLYEEIVKMDLEGIVCKRKDSPYKVTENPSIFNSLMNSSESNVRNGRKAVWGVGFVAAQNAENCTLAS